MVRRALAPATGFPPALFPARVSSNENAGKTLPVGAKPGALFFNETKGQKNKKKQRLQNAAGARSRSNFYPKTANPQHPEACASGLIPKKPQPKCTPALAILPTFLFLSPH